MNRRLDTGNNVVDKLQEKIATLKLQLEAQIVRCSHLQARLSSALDAMETLQYTHAREIAAERETKVVLNTKVNGLAEYVQRVEEERDELRDAVLALVEKVEVSNDYSLWPYSRVRLPHTLEPLQDLPANGTGSIVRSSAEAQDFGPFVVAALRTELEKERVSHLKTHDSAELEIACLRSQLARRDAELQACVAHVDHAALLQEMHGLLSPKSPVKRHAPAAFAPEETARILGLATATNRELEIENRELMSRLEESRGKMKHPFQDNERRIRSHSSPSGSRGEGLRDSHIASHSIARFPSPSPASPKLPPYSRHDSPSPYTMTPRIPGTPNRAHHTQLDREDVAQSHSSRSTLADLGDEVQKLGNEIEMLHQQREKWQEHLRSDSDGTVSGTAVMSSYKEGAVQAAASDSGADELAALRVELEAFKQKATQREAELAAEILKLRYALAKRHAESASPGETDTLVALVSPLMSKDKQVPDNQTTGPSDETAANVTVLVLPSTTESSLADRIDALWENGTGTEQSMELGTPLRPSVIINDGDTIVMTNAPVVSSPSTSIDLTQINPLLVPLPDSPASSPRVRASTPLTSDDVRSAAIRDRPPTPFKFPSPTRGQIDDADDTETLYHGSAPPAVIVNADSGVEGEADVNEQLQRAGEDLETSLQDVFAGD